MPVLNPSGRFAAAALMCTAVVVITGGCSTSDGRASSSTAGAQQPAGGRIAPQPAQGGDHVAPQPAQGGDRVAPQPAQGGTTDKPGAGAPAQLPADSRALIFTGTVTIRVSDVDRTAAEVSALATGSGGFVGGDDRTSDSDRSQARLILRVPSARFTSVVDGVSRLGANGRDESRQLSTEDVTDQVTDLDARIATGQASVDRVRELLARAQNIGEIVSLESELSRREADLESLKSHKRTLDDLTTLSTLTAVILGPQAAGKAGTHRPETGFLAGLKSGWRAFAGSLRILLTVLGALLPWLLGLGLPVLAALWALRRLRRPRPQVPAAPQTAPVTPPMSQTATSPAQTQSPAAQTQSSAAQTAASAARAAAE